MIGAGDTLKVAVAAIPGQGSHGVRLVVRKAQMLLACGYGYNVDRSQPARASTQLIWQLTSCLGPCWHMRSL